MLSGHFMRHKTSIKNWPKKLGQSFVTQSPALSSAGVRRAAEKPPRASLFRRTPFKFIRGRGNFRVAFGGYPLELGERADKVARASKSHHLPREAYTVALAQEFLRLKDPHVGDVCPQRDARHVLEGASQLRLADEEGAGKAF